uniref:Uncharacterized protein n=1 Tax=Siphoviridae sp. ctLNL10 TaxID=2825453 RepID=A0A8S5Q4S9_9CAUD|nr:MAG TPA: hypothetical protein [Siphoviridae sp. ctLNL10]
MLSVISSSFLLNSYHPAFINKKSRIHRLSLHIRLGGAIIHLYLIIRESGDCINIYIPFFPSYIILYSLIFF